MLCIIETSDIEAAKQAERESPPGSYLVKLYLLNPLGQEKLDELQSTLLKNGIQLLKPLSETIETPSTLSIHYCKPAKAVGFVWALLIPFIPIAIYGSLIALGIFKIETITKAILPVLLVTGGLLIVALVVGKEPLVKYVERH